MPQFLFVGLLLIALSASHAETLNAEDEIVLASVTASVESVPKNHFLDGTIEAVNRSTVSAQTGGQIQEILFDVDDFVEFLILDLVVA